MSDYYKITGTNNPAESWATEVVLEVNDKGEPTKVFRLGEPAQISATDRDKLKELGFVVDSSSKTEADKVQEEAAQAPGGDVAGGGPVFGGGSEVDQAENVNKSDSSKGESKSTK